MKNQIKDIITRLTKLEKAVFGEKKDIARRQNREFIGPAGGLRLCISKGFFKNAKRSLAEVKNNLAKEGYYYSLQAVQNALNRFSKPNGPLNSLKESGKKVYVERK